MKVETKYLKGDIFMRIKIIASKEERNKIRQIGAYDLPVYNCHGSARPFTVRELLALGGCLMRPIPFVGDRRADVVTKVEAVCRLLNNKMKINSDEHQETKLAA